MRLRQMSHRIRLVAAALVLGVISVAAAGGRDAIKSDDLRDWLTFIASDALEGRAIFSTGIGLAAAYIEEHLRTWGVKPAGDNGSYLQTVRVVGVKSTSHSTLTVQAGGETRTFADGCDVNFPRNVGAKRRSSVDRVQFAGYGLDAPGAGQEDFHGLDVKGAAVVWLGGAGPKGLDPTYRRLLGGRSRYATDQLQALASIGPEATFGGRGGGPPGGPAAAPGAPASAGQPTQSTPGQPQAGQPAAGRGGFGGRFDGCGSRAVRSQSALADESDRSRIGRVGGKAGGAGVRVSLARRFRGGAE